MVACRALRGTAPPRRRATRDRAPMQATCRLASSVPVQWQASSPRGVKGVHGVALQLRNAGWARGSSDASRRRPRRALRPGRPCAQLPPRMLASRMRSADPRRLPDRDALDEAGHVDVGGAGGGAGRVKTVQAAVGLNDGGLRRERRLELAEPLAQLRIVR